jgi:exopolysaccharide biosynthesis operon protein EpsL
MGKCRHGRRWLAASLMMSCAGVSAWAQSEDPVVLQASYTRQTDSNLFRLPAAANVLALTGHSSASETIGITSIGVAIRKAYSLQQFELNASLADYRYQKFDYLNFTANQYSAAWRWSVTPRLHGTLGGDRSESLNSFADVQGSTLRNQRTLSGTRLTAEYEIDGPWRVQAGLSHSTQTNSQPVLTGDDYSADAVNVGLRHVWASGSQAGYSLNQTNGSARSGAAAPGAAFDDQFHQTEHTASLHWLTTGNSTVDLSASGVRRTHPRFSQRDYSGVNTSANASWRVSGKSTLVAAWARELSGYQATGIDYIRTSRLSVGPVWQISPFAVARLQHVVTQREYLGRQSGAAAARRTDTMRDTSASIDWQPQQRITLTAGLTRARRASDLAGLDYHSNLVTLTAQLTY